MELRIHAKLAIKVLRVPALELWYACRGLDPEGSGRVVMTKDQIEEMSNSRFSTWRWLNNKDLFQRYRYDRSLKAYVIYYKSLLKVCRNLGVKSLGGIGWSDTSKDLAQQAAYIEAIKIQQQSAWLAKQNGEGFDVIKPETYFNDQGEPLFDISTGSRAARRGRIKEFFDFNNRRLALLTKTPAQYGASLAGIAKSLDICRVTAGSLLTSAKRIQLAQYVKWEYFWRAKFEQEENMGVALENGFFFTRKKRPLKLLPYRYYPMYSLCSQKRLRTKLNSVLPISQDII